MNNIFSPSSGKISLFTANRLLESLTHSRIQIRGKYLTFLTSITERYSLLLKDYLTHEEWAKERRLVCPEDYSKPLQEAITKAVSNNDISLEGANIDRVSIHTAYGGSVTPMHFDWDNSRIQHLCLFGTRNLWLCPPGPQYNLPSVSNSILADFEEMSVEQRERTLIQFGATKFEMKPGDFVRFPSIWWHLVEYTQASVAISIRTEIDPLLRPLTILPRSTELQYVLYGLLVASSEKKINTISALVRSFLSSLMEEDTSLILYETAIRQTQDDLGLKLMSPNPWIVPKAFQKQSDLILRYASCISNKLKMNREQKDLCQEWLFGYWPRSCHISATDMSGLTELMCYTLEQPDQIP